MTTRSQRRFDVNRDAMSRIGLAGLMAGAGVLHLTVPEAYRQIVPGSLVLGHVNEAVLISGLAEIGCAAAIMVPRTRRLGGWATVALLIAVFPANVKMALDGGAVGMGFPLGSPVVAWLRLPLQVPLILWARSVARQG